MIEPTAPAAEEAGQTLPWETTVEVGDGWADFGGEDLWSFVDDTADLTVAPDPGDIGWALVRIIGREEDPLPFETDGVVWRATADDLDALPAKLTLTARALRGEAVETQQQ
jgi:hypothetical protein